MQRPGVLLLLESSIREEGLFCSSLIIGEFKTYEGEFKAQEKQVAQVVSYQNQPGSLEQRSLSGGVGLTLHPVRQVLCLFQASLKQVCL